MLKINIFKRIRNQKKSKKVFYLFILAIILIPFIYYLNSNKISQDPQRKYNMIIIISDALRYDALGCCGGKAKTPNIDWLAKNGTLFQKAYSTSPWTAPSSVSMLTGHYASIFENGIRVYTKSHKKPSYHVPDSFLTLPELMKKFNYDVTLSINNWNALISNNMQGFQRFKKYRDLKNNEKIKIEKITGIKAYNHGYKLLYPVFDYFLKNNGKHFFTIVWINDPHSPYNPTYKYKNKIKVDRSKLRKNLDFYSHSKGFQKWENRKNRSYEIDYIKNLYLAEVESVDERVGFIIKILKYKNLLKDTFIVFSSDHGEAFGQHRLFTHGTSYYEDLMHVPLIYFGPNIPGNLKIDLPVSNLDLMPTIKDILGLSFKDSFQGKSYFPLLSGKSVNSRLIYFDGILKYSLKKKRKKFVDAILVNNFKLITKKKNKPELYNLLNDSQELSNIAAQKKELVKKLLKQIFKLRKTNENLSQKYLKTNKKNKIIKENRKKALENLKALGYIN